MVWKIVVREVREYLASFRFGVILALTLVLMAAVVLVAAQDYGNQLRDYPKKINIVQEDGSMYLNSISGNNFPVRQRPEPLAFLAGIAGQELPEDKEGLLAGLVPEIHNGGLARKGHDAESGRVGLRHQPSQGSDRTVEQIAAVATAVDVIARVDATVEVTVEPQGRHQ